MTLTSLSAFSDRKLPAKPIMNMTRSERVQMVGDGVVGIGDEVGAGLGPIFSPPPHEQHCSAAVKSTSS